jgi:hypothetical protein
MQSHFAAWLGALYVRVGTQAVARGAMPTASAGRPKSIQSFMRRARPVSPQSIGFGAISRRALGPAVDPASPSWPLAGNDAPKSILIITNKAPAFSGQQERPIKARAGRTPDLQRRAVGPVTPRQRFVRNALSRLHATFANALLSHTRVRGFASWSPFTRTRLHAIRARLIVFFAPQLDHDGKPRPCHQAARRPAHPATAAPLNRGHSRPLHRASSNSTLSRSPVAAATVSGL